MHACMHTNDYGHACVFIHACMHMHTKIHTRACKEKQCWWISNIHKRQRMYFCTHTHIYMHIYAHIRSCVCMHVGVMSVCLWVVTHCSCTFSLLLLYCLQAGSPPCWLSGKLTVARVRGCLADPQFVGQRGSNLILMIIRRTGGSMNASEQHGLEEHRYGHMRDQQHAAFLQASLPDLYWWPTPLGSLKLKLSL